MVELLVDIRKAVRRDGRIILIAHQEQAYTQEAYNNMLNEWKKELKSKREWLKNYDKHLADGKKTMAEQIEAMRKQLEFDAKNLAKGIKELGKVEE